MHPGTFLFPMVLGIAVDGASNLLIEDRINDRVRPVGPQGEMGLRSSRSIRSGKSHLIQHRIVFDSRRPLSILVEEFLTGAILGRTTDYDRGQVHFTSGTRLARYSG